MTFVLAMVRYPEVYRKAQHELDSVIGDHRLPDFDDRGSLPYLECIMKEVYRCVTVILWEYPVAYSALDGRWGATVPLGNISMPSFSNDRS